MCTYTYYLHDCAHSIDIDVSTIEFCTSHPVASKGDALDLWACVECPLSKGICLGFGGYLCWECSEVDNQRLEEM